MLSRVVFPFVALSAAFKRTLVRCATSYTYAYSHVAYQSFRYKSVELSYTEKTSTISCTKCCCDVTGIASNTAGTPILLIAKRDCCPAAATMNALDAHIQC